jgi:hypothetical protein
VGRVVVPSPGQLDGSYRFFSPIPESLSCSPRARFSSRNAFVN